MLIIIYSKEPQKAEDWAAQNRTPEKLFHVRDLHGFKLADIEPCDEIWVTEESALIRKAYRAEKIKLFNYGEEKQRTVAPAKVTSRRRKRAS